MDTEVGDRRSVGSGRVGESAGHGLGMSDVFISYASEDEEFVDRLRGALGRRGREVWVYTDGILPSDEWEIAAHEAIERSDALVFVMSKSSLESGPCLGELDYAFALKKRVIPVCIEEEVKEQSMPDGLAAKAWIMMRASGDFNLVLDRVIDALDTDLELARVHTRILVRAEAWDRGDRGKSPLLRGEELRSAQQWLARAVSDGGPQPTELHREFLTASTREASARRWRISLVSALAVAVVGALAVLALVLQRQANSRQEVALSRQLAKEASDSFTNHRPDVGILLSLEAERSAPTVEALSSLVRSVEAIPAGMVAFRFFRQNETAAMYSPGGRTVALASGELWDPNTGRVVRIPVGGDALMAFSPDGSVVASAGTGDGTVKLWDVSSRKLLRRLPTHTDYVTSVAFSPDGRTLAAATDDATIVRWNLRTGSPLGRPLREPSQVNSVSYSPDGRFLAAGTDTGRVAVLNGSTGNPISSFSLGQSVYQLAFSYDGRTLAAAIGSGKVVLRNLRSGTEKAVNAASLPQNSRSNPQVGVAFSPREQVVATDSNNGQMMLWSSVTGQLLRAEPHDVGINSVAFSPDGNTIVTVDSAGKVILWDTRSELALGQSQMSNAAQVTASAFSPDGRLLAIGRDDGSIEVSDQRTGRVVWHFSPPSLQGDHVAVETLAFSPNADVLVSGGDDQAIRLWNAQTGELLRATSTDSLVSEVAFSPDGGLLAAGVDDAAGTVLISTGATGAPVRMLRAGAAIYAVAWLTGRRVAAATASGIVVWDAANGKRTHRIAGGANTMNIASTPDGTILAVLNASGSVTLWDTSKWTQLESVTADAPASDLTFTRDGQTMAASNSNGWVQMWNVGSGQQVGDAFRVPQRIPAQPTGVNTLSFNPASTSLVMGTSDGTIVRLNSLPFGNAQDTDRFLCGVVRRNLDASQWRQLVPAASYHATCGRFGY